MSDYDFIFKGIADTFGLLLLVLAISVPLGLWKLVEIIIWVYKHISF